MAFDWDGLKQALVTDIVAFVRDNVGTRTPYGVALFGFYSDRTVIGWPMIGIGFDDDAAGPDMRWSPYDWETTADPSDDGDAWSARLSDFAASDRGKRWDQTERRFERIVVAACEAARQALIAEALIPKSTLVVALDEGEHLVPKCLTRAQLIREFGHLDSEAAERSRVAALPVSARIEALLDAIEFDDKPLNWESASPLLYDVAHTDHTAVVDAPLRRLTVEPGRRYCSRHRWISALSDLGADRDDVVAALTQIMLDDRDPENVRSWAGSALCRLGHIPLVAAHIDSLPPNARRSFAAPYKNPLPGRPIDFAPLEAALAADPDLDEFLCTEIGLNHDVTGATIDTMFAALESPWPCIRRHAAWSLVFARLSRAQESRFRTALDVLADDPSPTVSGRVDDLRQVLDRG